MEKKNKESMLTVGVGAVIGAGATYAIMKNTPCEGCTCERQISDASIRKHKEEYLHHRESNKCFTDPCESCPHKV